MFRVLFAKHICEVSHLYRTCMVFEMSDVCGAACVSQGLASSRVSSLNV